MGSAKRSSGTFCEEPALPEPITNHFSPIRGEIRVATMAAELDVALAWDEAAASEQVSASQSA